MAVAVTTRDGVTVLAPQGDLDGVGYVELVDAFERAAAEKRDRVVLDLGRVAYINSICIGYLIQFWRDLSRQGGSFAVAGTKGEVDRLLSIGGVKRYIRFFGDLAEAVQACAAGLPPGETLAEEDILQLLRHYLRIGLSSFLSCDVRASQEGQAEGDDWWQVTLAGDLEGKIGLRVDAASTPAIARHMRTPGVATAGDAVQYLVDSLFDAGCSGIEEMGYKIERGTVGQGPVSGSSHVFSLSFEGGRIVVAADLVKRATRRREKVPG